MMASCRQEDQNTFVLIYCHFGGRSQKGFVVLSLTAFSGSEILLSNSIIRLSLFKVVHVSLYLLRLSQT